MRASAYAGDAHLVNVGKRFQMDRTLAYSLVLFNAIPKRSRLVKYPDVPMHSLPTEPRQAAAEAEDWWLRLVRGGLHGNTQARPVQRDGSLTRERSSRGIIDIASKNVNIS